MKTIAPDLTSSTLNTLQGKGNADYSLIKDEDINQAVRFLQDERNATSRDYDLTLQAIMKYLSPSVFKYVQGVLPPKNGHNWVSQNWEDIDADVNLFIFRAIKAYRISDKGSLMGYVLTSAKQSLVKDVRDSYSSQGTMDTAWVAVRAAMLFELDNFRDTNGFEPSLDELKALVELNLISRHTLSLKKKNPKLKAKENYALSKAYLSRQGYTKAINELAAIHALGTLDLRLDVTLNKESGATFGEVTLVETSFESSDEEILDLIFAVGLGVNQWAKAGFAAFNGALEGVLGTNDIEDETLHSQKDFSFTKYAEEVNRPKELVKSVLKLAPLRLQAPHAQFAYTKGTLVEKGFVTDEFAGYLLEDFH